MVEVEGLAGGYRGADAFAAIEKRWTGVGVPGCPLGGCLPVLAMVGRRPRLAVEEV